MEGPSEPCTAALNHVQSLTDKRKFCVGFHHFIRKTAPNKQKKQNKKTHTKKRFLTNHCSTLVTFLYFQNKNVFILIILYIHVVYDFQFPTNTRNSSGSQLITKFTITTCLTLWQSTAILWQSDIVESTATAITEHNYFHIIFYNFSKLKQNAQCPHQSAAINIRKPVQSARPFSIKKGWVLIYK